MPTLKLTKTYSTYPEYKDSGIEWLGKIPKDWGVEKLKFVAPIVTEKVTKENLRGTYVALENVESKTGKYIPSEQNIEPESIVNTFADTDVLFGKLRPYLAKVFAPNFSGTSTGEFLVLRPSKKILKRYLFYRILSQEFINVVNDSTYGAQMPRASWNFIGNVGITLAGFDEQKHIADYLDKKTALIDQTIEKKLRQIELLREKRTAVINQAVTRGLDPNVELVESGIEWIGKIPRRWQEFTLRRVAQGFTNGTSAEQINNGFSDYPVTRIETISSGVINLTKVGYLGEKDATSKYQLLDGDILLSHINSLDCIGNSAIYSEKNGILFHGMNLLRLIPNKNLILPNYLFYLLNSDFFKSNVKKISKRSINQVSIPVTHLKNIKFPLPSLADQVILIDQLECIMEIIDTAIQKIEKSIELLKEFKSSLISHVVTGKIKI